MSSYQVVYLNGPSSVGKSTLARALQEKLPTYFLHIGIDRIIGMMPLKTNDWEGDKGPLDGFYWKEESDLAGHRILTLQQGDFAAKIISTYHAIVLTLLQEEHSVIIDDVAFGQADVEIWQELLAPYKVLWVGLSAPIEILEAREIERKRPLGSTRAQYLQVHDGVKYDLMLDSSKYSTSDIVQIILKSF